MWLLGIIVGAIGFRLRGDAIFHEITGRGAITARIVCWAVPMGLLSLSTVPWWASVWVTVGFFLGAALGWYGSLDLGRNEGDPVKDRIIMTARGLVWTLPAALVVWQFDIGNAIALMIIGLACPLFYELGYRTPSRIPYLRQGPEVGEVLFGAAIGLALTI
jgi:cell division protein FtsW (lipid II flippase)